MRLVLEGEGLAVETFATCESFLAAYRPGRDACLLVDANLPGMTGLELLHRIGDVDRLLPAIMFTGKSDVTTAVKAMQAGALDYMEKPVLHEALLANVGRALEQSRALSKLQIRHKIAANQIASLTPREREVLNLILAGRANKCIAADLSISQRTVENHRAAIMRKTGTKSLPALARLALVAAESGRPASVDDNAGAEQRPADRDRAALTRVG
jgi:two-component system CheB/CheR fusion protein